MQEPLALHPHGSAVPRVSTHPRAPDLAGEIPEPPNFDPLALGEAVHNLIEDRVKYSFHHGSRQMRMRLKKLSDQFRADHGCIFFLPKNTSRPVQAWSVGNGDVPSVSCIPMFCCVSLTCTVAIPFPLDRSTLAPSGDDVSFTTRQGGYSKTCSLP